MFPYSAAAINPPSLSVSVAKIYAKIYAKTHLW